jgi:hypothetical protein
MSYDSTPTHDLPVCSSCDLAPPDPPSNKAIPLPYVLALPSPASSTSHPRHQVAIDRRVCHGVPHWERRTPSFFRWILWYRSNQSRLREVFPHAPFVLLNGFLVLRASKSQCYLGKDARRFVVVDEYYGRVNRSDPLLKNHRQLGETLSGHLMAHHGASWSGGICMMVV